MKNIVLFASGNGTNAENICLHFKSHPSIRVVALFCNNPQAGVIAKIKNQAIPVELFTKAELQDPNALGKRIATYAPDLIVLAGFLWLIPPYLVQQYPNQIMNIHPALLPAFGGKGMYGMHVHNAVIEQRAKTHGITIHLVNEHYDEGTYLFQQAFNVTASDTAATVAAKIAVLEMTHFPNVIEQHLLPNT